MQGAYPPKARQKQLVLGLTGRHLMYEMSVQLFAMELMSLRHLCICLQGEIWIKMKRKWRWQLKDVIWEYIQE